VAERGVETSAVEEAVALLQSADAAAPGILWLEPAWALAEDDDRQRLAEAIDVPITGPSRLRDRAWRRVIAALRGGSVQGDPLEELSEGGFLSYQGVGGSESSVEALAGAAEQVVLVSGPASELGGDVTVAMGRALVTGGVPTLVAEVWRDEEDGPGRGSALSSFRDDEALGEAVATVDDLDLVQGRVAAALALADLRSGVRGHFGYGPGADGPLPDRPAP
jgi:hypothetical protein